MKIGFLSMPTGTPRAGSRERLPRPMGWIGRPMFLNEHFNERRVRRSGSRTQIQELSGQSSEESDLSEMKQDLELLLQWTDSDRESKRLLNRSEHKTCRGICSSCSAALWVPLLVFGLAQL
jgi:hypothetical protein